MGRVYCMAIDYVTVMKYGKYREVVTLTNCELPVGNGGQLVGSDH